MKLRLFAFTVTLSAERELRPAHEQFRPPVRGDETAFFQRACRYMRGFGWNQAAATTILAAEYQKPE